MHSELGTSNWHFNGTELRRAETPGHSASVFQAVDGHVYMMFLDREWPRVAQMIGRPDLAHDRRFMARYERTSHLDELDALLTPWFLSHTAREAVELGQSIGMPLAYGQSAAEALADPQLKYRGAFETIAAGPSGSAISFPTGIGRYSEPGYPRKRGAGPEPEPISFTSLLSMFRMSQQANAAEDGSTRPGRPEQSKPLTGVRVIDLTNTWAGPRGAMLLGDLGAEIIKFEGVEWMDVLRGFTTPPAGNPSYPRGEPGDRPWDRYIMWLGGPARNKRSLAAELTRQEARTILDELVAISDVVMTNMSASTRAKYRLDFDRLAIINPRIIYAVLSGYGDEGPRSSWRLFGDGQASMAALFAGTGNPGDGTVPLGTIGDPINGTALAFHIVEALLLRERSGRGMSIDISAVESCLPYAVRSVIEAQIGVDSMANVGFDAQGRWPHGVFRCLGEDSWVAISCGTDDERRGLVEGMRALGVDCDGLPDDEGLQAVAWPVLLERICAAREPDTLESALRWRGVPCQRVMRTRAIDGDAILASRAFITWLWREDLGSYPAYSAAWLINAERPAITYPPPRLGQDNEYVLDSLLGKDSVEYADLYERGVIGDTPVRDAELGLRSLTTES
jgi:crotonobetainyl-CoA:carnitine CoA-transferase CaiB-like acyl-CoA transferase